MPFTFTPTKLSEVILIKPRIFEDERGHFLETFKDSEFAAHGITGPFKQDNQSFSLKIGTLRGLHYQLEPSEQGKIVRVLKGEIFDVAVDVRRHSPTFSRWVGYILNDENKEQLWIPPGFAHGFMTLRNETIVSYKTTNEYAPQAERSIIWNDPDIGIAWPISEAILAAKDADAPRLKDAEINFMYKEDR